MGTVFASAGVLLIVFRGKVAAASDLLYRPWWNLIRSSHRTKPVEVVVMGSAWAAMGTFLAVMGFIYL